jgi:hypothetical protein
MFSDLGKDFTWIQRHERIIIVAMVLAVSAFGLNKWLDKSAMDAASKAAVAQQVAAVQHDADQKIAAAVAQQTALFNHEQAVREQEMASLVAAVASRDTASNNRVKGVLAPKETPAVLADLWAAYPDVDGFDPAPITADGKIAFSVPVVQQFTATRLKLDTAQADLIDTKKELDVTTEGLVGSTALVGSLQGQVTGLQTELKTQGAAADAELKSVKASARKSKLGWFKVGFGIGFVTGLVTGHYIP